MQGINKYTKKSKLFLPACRSLLAPFEARSNKIIPNLAKPSTCIDLSIFLWVCPLTCPSV